MMSLYDLIQVSNSYVIAYDDDDVRIYEDEIQSAIDSEIEAIRVNHRGDILAYTDYVRQPIQEIWREENPHERP